MPALPTAALASPKPTRPPSVSTRTSVESNALMRPKSVVCCFSSGIGTCSQSALILRIFIT